MVSLIYQRSAYLLTAIMLLVFNPRELSAQALADQKNIFPTFYSQNIIRVHPDEIQLTVSDDYTFYKPDDAARSHFKNDLHTAVNKQDSLLIWGQTNIPSAINMYLLRGTEQGVMSVTKNSPGDSLQADNTTIYEHIADNDPSNVIAAYTFHKNKWYTLVFHTSFPQKGIDDNAQRTKHFIAQTRAIITTLQVNVPDPGINFFGMNPTDQKNTYTAGYKPVKTISLKDSSQFTTTNAKAYILQQAAGQKALFFNESHVDVRTRAFLTGLLPELKKLGYTKLAMEALMTDTIAFPTTKNTFHITPPANSLLLIYDADEYEKAGNIYNLVPVYAFYPANTYHNLSLDRKKYIVYLFDNKGKLLSHQKIAIKEAKAARKSQLQLTTSLQP